MVAAPAPAEGGAAEGAAPKRVSFTGGEQRLGAGAGAVAWPTRNGPAPQPPTRQHLEPAPLRPLLHLPPHLHYHSESESGSEAGEVQRILTRHRPGAGPPPPPAANKGSTKKKRKFGREARFSSDVQYVLSCLFICVCSFNKIKCPVFVICPTVLYGRNIVSYDY
ncbi:Protein of unknown function, partial [Gryllus bimaculatus]